MPDHSLDLQDYLEATSDAAKRTRTVLIALVVGAVLTVAGLLNSLGASWMLARVHDFRNPQAPYVESKLGYQPKDENDPRYQQFYTALARSYVENAFTVRVPFFGFTFDVNDLGLLAGLGFIVILLLLRFSLRSEIISLRLSFKAVADAADVKKLATFYDLLAMRQVLTMPHVEVPSENWASRTNRILRVTAKSLCFVPAIVYTFVALHDYSTLGIGIELSKPRTDILKLYTVCFWLIIVALGVWCFRRWLEIDRLWERYWTTVAAADKAGHER